MPVSPAYSKVITLKTKLNVPKVIIKLILCSVTLGSYLSLGVLGGFFVSVFSLQDSSM